jgi:dTDP-4-dehydrorhamnose reductase
MRVLVTGGSGLLGSKITELLLEKGLKVFSGEYENSTLFGNPVKLDVTKRSEVENAFLESQPEVVIHAAALTNVDKCEREKELANKINVEGTLNIVKCAEDYGSELVFVSTDYVFSGEKGNYRETDETNPVNHYGVTKLEAEKIVQDSELDYSIVRPSVIFGAREASVKKNFILWVLDFLKKGNQLKIVNDQIVSPTYNANLSLMIIDLIEKKLGGVYHLAGATQINRYDLALMAGKIFGFETNLIQPVSSSQMNWLAKRPMNSSLSIEKANKYLDIKPLSIRQALMELKIEMG